jgi:hypothetical protein
LRLDFAEARRRVARAEVTGPRRSLTGEPLLPELAAALEHGTVSSAHSSVIIDCLEGIPPTAAPSAWPVAEALLVRAAGCETPRQLRRTAGELLARLDPDGVEPAAERAERSRSFVLVRRRDGTSAPRGVWTAELTAMWEAILDSLAAPQADADNEEPDPRSAGQRRHDAMAEAAARLLRSGALPPAGGVPVTILATTTVSELTTALGGATSGGLARLGHGELIPLTRLLAMAGEAQVMPVVLADTGGVIAYGRSRRLASREQRLALVARDGGCTFPDCERPAAWSEVHHVREWARGGATDLDNMTLVCRFHHRHFGPAGWRVRMTAGRPEWIPPAWLDPQQAPRHNAAHHRREFEFRQPGTAA